jgi:Cu/Ag efflux protein CusF
MRKCLLALGAALLSAAAFAQAALPVVEAEVHKVDLEMKKITLRHGEIPNLEMPPMTMVFGVQDPSLLTRAKAGDKVRVTIDKINGQLTVTTLELSAK